MGIFAQLDAENIPTNPFWVEAGTYSAEVTDAKYKNNNKGQRQLVIEYTINDQDSQFLDQKLAHYFTLPDPDLTQEKFNNLPAEEQKAIRRTLSSMKKTLCGSSATQRGLGVPVEDLNDDNWNPEVLKGIKVEIGVKNYGADNNGVNISWVNLDENA